MSAFAYVNAPAALRPYCEEGTTKAGAGAGGNEAGRVGCTEVGRVGSTEVGRMGSTETDCC